MNKKTFFGAVVLVLVLVVGGFFYWWQNQTDVRALNKTLPEGVKVVKSLFSDDYGVVNKIDGYEFKVPSEWRGIDEIAHVPERMENNFVVAGIELAGKEGVGRVAIINQFKEGSINLNLMQWAKNNFETFGLIGDFSQDNVEGFDVVKTQENVHLGGMYVYFFKGSSAIYAITNGSEDFIRYIIANGQW